MVHCARGTSGNRRYGWKPKHNGTAVSAVAATVVCTVSVRSTNATRTTSRWGNGKLASSAGSAPKSSSATSSLADSVITRQPGWAASTPWMGSPLGSARTPFSPGVSVTVMLSAV